MKNYCFVILIGLLLSACGAANKAYQPNQKYGKEALISDYNIARKILSSKHPSLYWYTSKDSMDYYFEAQANQITDSMTAQQFIWQVMAPLINKIHCGHTSISMGKSYQKWRRLHKPSSFPFHLKVWNDSMVVMGTVYNKDTLLKKGTLIKSINDLQSTAIIQTMLNHLPEDGYAHNVNYIRISSNFPTLHTNIFGLSKNYRIQYIDSLGKLSDTVIAAFVDSKPQGGKVKKTVKAKQKRFPKNWAYRSLEIDSTHQKAFMRLNNFSNGSLRRFFKKSFKSLKQNQVKNLVIDLRYNGGGFVNKSILFTKYLSQKPFKVADSVYATARTLAPYTNYFKGGNWNNIKLYFLGRKKSDAKYHLQRYERKNYKPKTKFRFDGSIYILINGPSFSATTLMLNAIKGQSNIVLVGEETGGGWYGNSGILLPEFVLPNTQTRLRMPLFRLVQFQHNEANKGKGVPPDILVPTSYDALIKGYDMKIKMVDALIDSAIHQSLIK